MINKDGVTLKKGDVLTWKNFTDRYEIVMAGPKRLKVQWAHNGVGSLDSYTYEGEEDIQPVIEMIKEKEVFVNDEEWIKPSDRLVCPRCESGEVCPPDYLCRKCRFG